MVLLEKQENIICVRSTLQAYKAGEGAKELNFATLINKLQKVRPRVLLNSLFVHPLFISLRFSSLTEMRVEELLEQVFGIGNWNIPDHSSIT